MRTVRRIQQANACVRACAYLCAYVRACVRVCVCASLNVARDSHCSQVLKVTLMDWCRTDTTRARSQEKEDNNQAGAEETMNRRLEKDKEMSGDGNRQQLDQAERDKQSCTL